MSPEGPCVQYPQSSHSYHGTDSPQYTVYRYDEKRWTTLATDTQVLSCDGVSHSAQFRVLIPTPGPNETAKPCIDFRQKPSEFKCP